MSFTRPTTRPTLAYACTRMATSDARWADLAMPVLEAMGIASTTAQLVAQLDTIWPRGTFRPGHHGTWGARGRRDLALENALCWLDLHGLIRLTRDDGGTWVWRRVRANRGVA